MQENHFDGAENSRGAQRGNPEITELVFILDGSGSMSGLEDTTIKGYNDLLAKQKELPGEAFVTTVIFNTSKKVIHDRVPVSEIQPLTTKDYITEGCTALLDAVGSTIHDIAHLHKHMNPEQKPGQTMVAITTDGLENASRHYTVGEVKQMIAEQTDENGWEFLFLGANMDAVAVAGDLGIQADRAVNYHADEVGSELGFRSFAAAAATVRSRGQLRSEWRQSIDEDFRKR